MVESAINNIDERPTVSRLRAWMILVEFIIGLLIIAGGMYLILPPLALVVPGSLLVIDAFVGGRQ